MKGRTIPPAGSLLLGGNLTRRERKVIMRGLVMKRKGMVNPPMLEPVILAGPTPAWRLHLSPWPKWEAAMEVLTAEAVMVDG